MRHFARSGAKVVFCVRRSEPLLALETELKREGLDVVGYPADVASPPAEAGFVGAALDRFGRVDVLVNSVGIAGPSKPIEETDLTEWNQTLAGNLTSTFLCLRAVVPAMKPRWWLCDQHWLGDRLTVLAIPNWLRICPGAVDGERLDEVLAGQARQRGTTPEQVREAFRSQSPLRSLVHRRKMSRTWHSIWCRINRGT